VTSFFGIKVCVFRKLQDESAPNFYSGFRRKHLFITTCIEKHCTQPLNRNVPHFNLHWLLLSSIL